MATTLPISQTKRAFIYMAPIDKMPDRMVCDYPDVSYHGVSMNWWFISICVDELKQKLSDEPDQLLEMLSDAVRENEKWHSDPTYRWWNQTDEDAHRFCTMNGFWRPTEES